MTLYLLRRLALAGLVLFSVSALTFLISRVVPSDPAALYAGQRPTEEQIALARERLGLDQPLVEFYYKDDALGDPFLSDDQALMLKAVPVRADLETLKKKALEINKVLQSEFMNAGLELIDFKLEFGRNSKGEIVLADEVSPDTCRLWDTKTGEKFDKDRFRRDLGRVEESYQEVLNRLLRRPE